MALFCLHHPISQPALLAPRVFPSQKEFILPGKEGWDEGQASLLNGTLREGPHLALLHLKGQSFQLGAGRKARATSGHTSGAITVHHDLLCREAQHILPLKKLIASTSAGHTCRFYQLSPDRYLHSLALLPENLLFVPLTPQPPPALARAWELHWQSAQDSMAVQVQVKHRSL